MAKKVKSAKGEIVDFDLMNLKQTLVSSPETVKVQQRKDFIDKRLKRKLKTKIAQIEKTESDSGENKTPSDRSADENSVDLEKTPRKLKGNSTKDADEQTKTD